MHVFIWLAGILTLASISSIDTFVVTRYDLETITNYHDTMMRSLRPFRYLDHYFENQNLGQFCHQLRESTFFDVTNNTDTYADVDDYKYTSRTFYITPHDLRRESQRTVFLERHGLNNNNFQDYLTFRCLDPAGEINRAIAPGLVPNTAFMSTYRKNDREMIKAGRRTVRWDAKLFAIIDAPAVILLETPNFENFIEARRGLQRDPLCDLKKLLKFRLCAAASIGLGPINHRYVERLPYNLYYQPGNDDESCRYLEGIDQTYPKMLLCSVKLTNSKVFKSFYLSFDDVVSKNVLFIEQVWNGSQYIYETQYLYVPLLDYLDLYKKAFKNVNI